MGFMLEELKAEEVKHLRIFDLNTFRGWLQLVGIIGFSTLALTGMLLVMSNFSVLQKDGLHNLDAWLNLFLGMYGMLTGWVMFNAIKGRHLSLVGLLFMFIFPPIGVYFGLLRYLDEKLFQKVLGRHSRINDSFIVINKH